MYRYIQTESGARKNVSLAYNQRCTQQPVIFQDREPQLESGGG